MRLTTASFALALSLGSLLCSLNAAAASKVELDTRVAATLERLYDQQPEARALGSKSVAILVFPQLIKAGIGVGGEVGEGALLANEQTVGYYRSTSVSVGLQLGVQSRSEVIMFMTETAYQDFVNNDGWEAGVDGSVALVEFGAGQEFSTRTIRDPIIGFIFGNKGLMYNLSLEGAKFWKINK